ncbi:MAG TPA: reverse transcriptase-like protein [Clostridiales bacterium]|nr:reverse transcriptase-like protein [Clostridiales bacterium]
MITIYTDGGCKGNPGKGGWATILIDETGEEFIASGNKKFTTNNHMELLAVLQGLFMLTEPSKVVIVTDSKYVENSFTKKWYERWIENQEVERPNYELWRMLYNLKDIHDIKIMWVKGHSGHYYNEKCDTIASKEMKKLEGFDFSNETHESSNNNPRLTKSKITKVNNGLKNKKNSSNEIGDYYAVAKGRKIGVFKTWGECELQVKKFKGAKFKKFDTKKEAELFINLNS